MNVTFTPEAWEEFQYWLSTDKNAAKKISAWVVMIGLMFQFASVVIGGITFCEDAFQF